MRRMSWMLLTGCVLALGACRTMMPDGETPPKVPPEHWEQNLVPNPDFETDADGDGTPDPWNLPGGMTAWDDQVAHEGDHSLRCTSTDPNVYRLCTAPIHLIPGVRYRYSVAVKGKDIRSSNPSDQGAGICIEWHDADGDWLGGSYAGCKAGTFDWTRVGGESAPVPDEAASAHVVVYLRKKSVGTAWFDAVEVQAIRGPLMRVTLLEPAYRATFETSTKPRDVLLEVAFNRREYAVAHRGLTLRLDLRARDGQPAADYPPRRFVPADEPTRVNVTVPPLPAGPYDLTVELHGPDDEPLAQDTARFHVVPPIERRVSIDERRRLVVDGEPFFPLGLYLGPTEDEHLARIADGGFNTILCYGYGVGKEPEAYLDRAQKHGLKVIYSIKDFYEGTRWFPKHKNEGDTELIREYVTRFRDHPAVIAWYTNDELGPGYLPKLKAAYNLVRTLDPHHPCLQVLCRPAENHLYYGVTDILGVDPYPIPRRPITMVGEWMDTAHAAMRDRKPAWCVPQIFGWGVYRHDPSIREPSFDEKRAMIYLALVHRAQGLICYSYYDQFKDIEAGKKVSQEVFERRWGEIVRIAQVVERIIPALLHGEEVGADLEGRVRFRVLKHDAKATVIAVNTHPSDSVTFALPVAGALKATKLDTRDAVTVEQGTLRDLLPPLGAAVYRVE
jgi:hypothetical protein